MGNTVEREYVIAGLVGLLYNQRPDKEFVDKYSISHSEQRRAACVTMQQLMGGGKGAHGDEAVRRVGLLAQRFGFTKDEVASAAWEVLRGTLDEKDPDNHEEDASEISLHILKYFLRDRLPKGSAFGYTGMVKAFRPPATEYSMYAISDLAYWDAGGNAENLPPELIELYVDLGLDR
jgi:hypothetical protein